MVLKKMRNQYGVILGVVLLVVVWLIWGNTTIETTKITVTSHRLPHGFDGYRIAQVSDLHNAEFGHANEQLLRQLQEGQPDIIVITGDTIDSRRTDIDVAIRFVEQAVKIAPCYWVTGNHESRIVQYAQLEEGIVNVGAVVLRDGAVSLEHNGETITLLGIDDPAFIPVGQSLDTKTSLVFHKIEGLLEQVQGYVILLSHRPELFEIYCANEIDLVFSGHAHGGQVRVPLIGAIIAPNQGFFPKYYGGLYTDGTTNMVVSRGIGNSLFPLRVNNRPELVLVELRRS